MSLSAARREGLVDQKRDGTWVLVNPQVSGLIGSELSQQLVMHARVENSRTETYVSKQNTDTAQPLQTVRDGILTRAPGWTFLI